jgi:predicted TIM-barrel fold metal-dependent hydrolase
MTIVLNHAGMVMNLDLTDAERNDAFAMWQRDMQELARRPNVACKISGFGMPFWGFGFETRPDPIGHAELAVAWRPYVETCIAAFGAERCMFASNFPPDGRSCGYVPIWNAYKRIARGSSADENAALFSATATRTYRIES